MLGEGGGIEHDIIRNIKNRDSPLSFVGLNATKFTRGTEGEGSFDKLLEALPTNGTIDYMNLGNCTIDGIKINAAHIAELVVAWKNPALLKVLDLGYNNIGDGGVDELVNILEKTPLLEDLNLVGNNISDNGAKSLLRAFKESNEGRKNELKLLHLNGNKITNQGALALFSNGKSVAEIKLDDNCIDTDITNQLNETRTKYAELLSEITEEQNNYKDLVKELGSRCKINPGTQINSKVVCDWKQWKEFPKEDVDSGAPICHTPVSSSEKE